LTLLALATLQSGCAHYYWPANRLESPEVIGKLEEGGKFGHLEILAIQSGTDLLEPAETQATDPETGTTPDPALSKSMINYAFGANFSVTPEFDVGIKLMPYAPVLTRVKYQLTGDPESKAQAGNLSASAAASAGLLWGNFDGESMTFYTGHVSLIGGYRFFKNHVASLAPFVSLAGISGIGDASGTGFRYGGGLGYQYDAEALILRLELIWASGSFSQTTGSVQAGGLFPGMLLALKF
jgi:hypothetical protein